MSSARNHYQILNVAPDAEAVVIEAAYRALMKKYHPDHAFAAPSPGPSASEINQAYSTLRNPERRAEYDRRERTRLQSVQLAAAYKPPPAQRVSRVFGWGGWVVAAVMGGVLAMMAGRVDELAFARAEAARAAASAEPDLRSQPSLPDEPMVTPAELAAIAVAPVPVPVPIAPPEELRVATPEELRVAAPQQERRAANAKARRPQPQRRRARTAAEQDFLEREGYIY
jgi:curved DNA-binding protein CbpA